MDVALEAPMGVVVTGEVTLQGGLGIEEVLNNNGHPKVWPDGSIVKRVFDAEGKTDWMASIHANPWAVNRGPSVSKNKGTITVGDRVSEQFVKCPDCGVMPGELHSPGCDVEQCALCGCQRISCKCPDYDDELRLAWSGTWPGYKEAIEYDLWCHFELIATGHDREKPCKKEDPGSKPDLSRLVTFCEWNAEQRRWVKRQTEQLTTSETA